MSVLGRVNMVVVVGMGSCVIVASPALAAEHGGKEHAGQEHGGAAVTTAAPAQASQPSALAVSKPTAPTPPTAGHLRARIASYVKAQSAKTGAFDIQDTVTGTLRRLKFVRVHSRVGKTGDYYYSCTDMKDTKTGELLDLDFDVEASDGRLEVVDVRIHKVQGSARYTYDEQDRRIPLP